MDLENEYRKYKWFFTSSKKLVIAGKSAEQNEELLKKIKSSDSDHIIMHTSSPGSPFSIILSPIKKVSEKDLLECATFTACFSKAWKLGREKESVDIFHSSQLNKGKSMKIGTWGVRGSVKRLIVPLELVLVKQKDILRAVPKISVINEKDILLKVIPGKIDKKSLLLKLEIELGESSSPSEILSALPSGGIRIIK